MYLIEEGDAIPSVNAAIQAIMQQHGVVAVKP